MSKVIPTESIKGLVSILIPAYNHENYIDDCLESILNQKYDNIEVIVCDDCSKDSTWEHIQSFRAAMESRGFPYTTYRHETNQGVCRTMNELLRASKGEFIKGIASDDIFADEYAITHYVEAFKADSEADILVGNACLIDGSTHLSDIDVTSMEKFYQKEPNFEMDGLLARAYKNNFILASTCSWRRSIYEVIEPYDENMLFEDWDFNLRAIEAGIRFKYLPDCLAAYRIVDTSLSHSVSEDGLIINMQANIQTLVKHADFVDARTYKRGVRLTLHGFYIKAMEIKSEKLLDAVKKAMKETGCAFSPVTMVYIRFRSFVNVHRKQ